MVGCSAGIPIDQDIMPAIAVMDTMQNQCPMICLPEELDSLGHNQSLQGLDTTVRFSPICDVV